MPIIEASACKHHWVGGKRHQYTMLILDFFLLECKIFFAITESAKLQEDSGAPYLGDVQKTALWDNGYSSH